MSEGVHIHERMFGYSEIEGIKQQIMNTHPCKEKDHRKTINLKNIQAIDLSVIKMQNVIL